MDRASPPKVVRQASLRLDFAKWEENGASLRSHFGALRSKIVRIHFGKSISLFPSLVFDNSPQPKTPIQASRPDLVFSNSVMRKARGRLSGASTLRNWV